MIHPFTHCLLTTLLSYSLSCLALFRANWRMEENRSRSGECQPNELHHHICHFDIILSSTSMAPMTSILYAFFYLHHAWYYPTHLILLHQRTNYKPSHYVIFSILNPSFLGPDILSAHCSQTLWTIWTLFS
jgi:hypothetical protein